jgi:NAD(P)-dependent dehydrogenase (short-subunit alcohol dehydrogenase family)
VVSDLNPEWSAETTGQILAGGGTAHSLPADVADVDQVEALIRDTVKLHGRLDCAHNNAGIEGAYGRTADCDEENFDRTCAVNLKGVYLCLKAEIAHMLGTGGGAIVNTASVAGVEGAKNLPAYVASKHGVVGLTRTAALEYATRGIRVNAVCPGPIRTRMLEALMEENPRMEPAMIAAVPMRRLGKPEEIAEAVVWLCSDRASYVTGQGIVVDGGFTAGS